MDKFQFAKLVSFVSVLSEKVIGESNLVELERLTNNFQSEPKPEPVNLTPLFTAIIQRRKIEAIKEYRTLTGFGLKESKDEVERLMYELTFEKKEGA